MPTTSAGVGNSPRDGSSHSTTPGASRSVSQAAARPTGREKRGVHRDRVGRSRPAPGRRSRTRSVGQAEDLARLVADLELLGGPAARRASEPAHGTTFSASGAGNGPRSPTAPRTSPGRWPSDLVAGHLVQLRRSSVSMPACPAPDTAWYEATTSSSQAVLAVQRADGHDHRQRGAVRVRDDALAAAARRRPGSPPAPRAAPPGPSGTPPSCPRTTAPRAAATGTQAADTSSGTSNMATSTPSKASG